MTVEVDAQERKVPLTTYQAEEGWTFDLEHLPPDAQLTYRAISSWLKEKQGWKLEGFKAGPSGPRSFYQFSLRAEHAPVKHTFFGIRESAFPYLGLGRSVNLLETLRPEILAAFEVSEFRSAYIHSCLGTVHPLRAFFLTPYDDSPHSSMNEVLYLKLSDPKVPFLVKQITLSPFELIDPCHPRNGVMGEDPSRITMTVAFVRF